MKFRFSIRDLFWVTICLGLLPPALCTICAGEETDRAIPVKYSSPEIVFDAYREAIGKRDWRTVYLCATLEEQKGMILETYIASQDRRQTKAIADVIKKFFANGKSLEGAKLPDWSDAAQVADFIYKGLDDPVGFVTEMNTVLHDADHPVRVPTKLHDVVVDGDTASGRASVLNTAPDSSFHFRKLNGGWLIDVPR